MTARLVSLAALLASALAAGAPPAAVEVPGEKASIAEVMAELRRLESARVTGQLDYLRVQYQTLMRQRPGDAMPRVFNAFSVMPADDGWNQLNGMLPVFPENPWIRYGMGRAYIGWRMKDKAKGEFEQALKRDPKFYPALIGLADLLRLADDHAGAEAGYRKALEVADDPLARTGLGLALKAQNKPEAKAELSKSLAAWPEQPAVLQALFELAQAEKGPELLELALKLVAVQPKNRDVRKLIADTRFERGEKDEAAKAYEELLRLGNPELAVVERVAALHREAKNAEGEERALVMQASLDKASAAPALRLAELKLAKKDVEGAIKQYEEAAARDPKSAEPAYRTGLIKQEQRALAQAFGLFAAAATLEGPQAAEAQAALTKLSAELKLPKKPLSGSLEVINGKVATSLDALFQELRRKQKDLGGALKARVKIEADGTLKSVEIVDDTVGEPVLAGHLYGLLAQAQYAKKKREVVLEFDLKGKKGK